MSISHRGAGDAEKTKLLNSSFLLSPRLNERPRSLVLTAM